MVAITHPLTTHPAAIATPAPRPAGPRPAGRRLQVVGPQAAGPSRLAPVLRRVGAVLLALVVALAVTHLVRAEPLPVAGSAPVLETPHVVAEGETMWSIAQSVAPAGEAAGYVERLVEANGTASVAPGEVLVLPVP